MSVLLHVSSQPPSSREMSFPPGTPEETTAALRWLFERRLSVVLAAQAISLLARDDAGTIVGCVNALQPGSPGLGLWLKAQQGLAAWPFRFGLASFIRALAIDSQVNTPAPGHWVVSMVAVDPAAQGGGIGTKLMQALIQRVTEEERGGEVKLYLNTQEEATTAFYGRFGFRVAEQVTVKENAWLGIKAFPSWNMRAELPAKSVKQESEQAE